MTTTKKAASTKPATKAATKPAVTKESLVQLRDHDQNSWAKVATALGLGSPGNARRKYSDLVRPHTDSVLANRNGSGGAKVTPVELSGANITTIRKAIVGKVIVVQRKAGTEEIAVAKVVSLQGDTISLHDGNKARSVKASMIVATK